MAQVEAVQVGPPQPPREPHPDLRASWAHPSSLGGAALTANAGAVSPTLHRRCRPTECGAYLPFMAKGVHDARALPSHLVGQSSRPHSHEQDPQATAAAQAPRLSAASGRAGSPRAAGHQHRQQPEHQRRQRLARGQHEHR